MQHHNFYMSRSCDLLKENGVDVYTVKTDALTIPQSQVERAKEALNWNEGIGSWRLNRTEDIKFPQENALLVLKENKKPEIAEPKTTPIELSLEDEYNTDKLCEYFEQHKRVMIRAEYAGCGKSYACEKMKKRGPVRLPNKQAGEQVRRRRLHDQPILCQWLDGRHHDGEV